MKNWNGLDILKNIKNGTLILCSENDKAYNYEQVKTLNDLIPNFNFENNKRLFTQRSFRKTRRI